MEQLLAFTENIKNRYQELTQGQKGAVWALFFIGISSIVAMSFWVQKPDYQLLYSNLAAEDAAAVVDDLKTQKIPYELAANGTMIRVPADKVHELRLQLAAKGLPEGGEVGMELFEDSSLGMTEFVQKLNYQRALEGELIRTIKSLDSISQARVHLVIPEENIFLREKPKGKASVTLKIKPGRSLTDSQVQGIVHLISGSVKGIDPENVAIVDIKGNILSGGQKSSHEAMLTGTNYKFKRNLEMEFENSVTKMLENALGPGKVIARVTSKLNFEKVERTEETYDPESQVVRSEQRATEAVVGAVPPGGVPGVQALLPTGQTPGGKAGGAAKKNNEKQTLNYEINKVIRHISEPTGNLSNLSVSVMIDGTLDEEGNYKARTPEEMATYLDLVKRAVGYTEQRGDKIKVENVQFDKTLQLQEAERLEQAEQLELGLEIGKILLGFIFVFLFYTRLIRPLVTWMTTSVELVDEDTSVPEIITTEEELEQERQRLAGLGPVAQEIRNAVNAFVETDPQFSASIVRKWLRERRVEE
jgi:flagellar M-ring protein FliF